jgi:hypothetical protein
MKNKPGAGDRFSHSLHSNDKKHEYKRIANETKNEIKLIVNKNK